MPERAIRLMNREPQQSRSKRGQAREEGRSPSLPVLHMRIICSCYRSAVSVDARSRAGFNAAFDFHVRTPFFTDAC